MLSKGLFTSLLQNWNTPRTLFDGLNMEFGFEVDLCADDNNALCERYFTKSYDALSKVWSGVCWLNPPYNEIAKWMEKAYFESRRGAVIVCLIPARTDTSWWHRFVMRSDEIRFIKGRIRFSGHKSNAPFPSAVVIFGKESNHKYKITYDVYKEFLREVDRYSTGHFEEWLENHYNGQNIEN